MPSKYKKKKTYKKRVKKDHRPQLTRQLKQRVLAFKRDFELPVIALENSDTWPNVPGLTPNWVRGANNQVCATMLFSLSQLPSHTEYKQLFQMYKLNYVVMKIYPSTSSVVSQNINEPIVPGTTGVSNFTITTWRNQTGQPLDATYTDNDLNQVPAKKRRLFPKNKPYVIKAKLNQLSTTFHSDQESVEVNTVGGGTANVIKPFNQDFSVRKPRYINTLEDSTPHFGLNIVFKKVDDSYFDEMSPRLKIMYTLYFTCKGLK